MDGGALVSRNTDLWNPNARVDIKNGQLKAIKAVWRLSWHSHVHVLMFKVSFDTTNAIKLHMAFGFTIYESYEWQDIGVP